jgi:hypothetical protein
MFDNCRRVVWRLALWGGKAPRERRVPTFCTSGIEC